jgi:hypothetical protein
MRYISDAEISPVFSGKGGRKPSQTTADSHAIYRDRNLVSATRTNRNVANALRSAWMQSQIWRPINFGHWSAFDTRESVRSHQRHRWSEIELTSSHQIGDVIAFSVAAKHHCCTDDSSNDGIGGRKLILGARAIVAAISCSIRFSSTK